MISSCCYRIISVRLEGGNSMPVDMACKVGLLCVQPNLVTLSSVEPAALAFP
jgi:hypothetical protein